MTLGFTEPKDFKSKIHTVRISIEANNLALAKFQREFDELQQNYLSKPFKTPEKESQSIKSKETREEKKSRCLNQ